MLPFAAPLLPILGKGLFWTGTAAGAAAGGYGLMGIPDDMRSDIIRQAPDDVTGEYKLNPIQKLLVDEDSLIDSRNKYVMNQAKKDVAHLQALDPSLQLTNGMTGDDFKKKYATQIRAAQLKNKLEESKKIAEAQYNSPTARDERETRDQQRLDLINEQRLTRQDTNDRFLYSERTADKRRAHEASEGKLSRRHQSELAEQSNDLQMKMSIMSNDLSEKRMAYDSETRRMDKRSAAIAQLMSGLGSLGGAFAL